MNDEREQTGSHSTFEARLVALETDRGWWKWIANVLATGALALAGGVWLHVIDEERHTAIAIAEMQREHAALVARVERAEHTRDAVAEQLGNVAVELGRLRVVLDGLEDRMTRAEQRLDGARR